MATDQSINEERRRKHNLMKQVFKAPVKFLAGARDLYVKSMVLADGQMGKNGPGYVSNGAILCTISHRSFSRARSTSDGARFVDEDRCNVEYDKVGMRAIRRRMVRSLSVGIERIDEDKVCEFGEEVMVRTKSSYVRRRTYY